MDVTMLAKLQQEIGELDHRIRALQQEREKLRREARQLLQVALRQFSVPAPGARPSRIPSPPTTASGPPPASTPEEWFRQVLGNTAMDEEELRKRFHAAGLRQRCRLDRYLANGLLMRDKQGKIRLATAE